ncbi:MAG: MotA/TolQ/ExbB proton channel family protein [Candidatus Omnitrophica bacterium]|nr:MotA/TolQ/ExbB proton channel family protein [Candidatus Omnitrophota bacterium]
MSEIIQKIGLLLLSIVVAFLLYLKVGIINKGGPVMILLIVCSIFALAIVMERFWLLHRMRLDASKFLEKIVDTLKRQRVKEAIESCDKSPHPIGLILKAGIVKSDRSREDIKEAMEDASLYEVPRMEKNLGLLATLAHICPLLGLLGTVMGLVRCFQVIQLKSVGFQPVSPGDLAGGIWEALITTVAGLSIAIPTYVAYNYLVNRVNSFILEMERSATELLNFLTERTFSES